MGVTVQVRDLDQAVHDRLKAAAASKGLSYSEYLRRELTRIAERLRIEERWATLTAERETRATAPRTHETEPFGPLNIDSATIAQWVREAREER